MVSKLSKVDAKKMLKSVGLRSTAPRLAVLRLLSSAAAPISHSEVLKQLGETDWDPATIYRNLVKLRDVKLAVVVSRAEGIDRYALAKGSDAHRHPHFVCENCGRVACLPSELASALTMDGPWSDAIAKAKIQFQGECPDCLENSTE